MKEVKLEVCGKEYAVRPTFRKIAAIEELSGRGVIEIYSDLSEGKIRFTDIANVLYCAVGELKVTQDKIGEEAMKDPAKYIKMVVEFLGASMVGSEELSGGEGDGSKEKND